MWNQVKTRDLPRKGSSRVSGDDGEDDLGRFGKTIFKKGHVQGCLEEGYDNFIILKCRIN